MNNQQYLLQLEVMCFFDENSRVVIPPYYYDHIINTYKHNAVEWDYKKAAALTLFSAFYDGVFEPYQLSYSGKSALAWAEQHIEDFAITHQENSRLVIKKRN